MAKSYIQDFFDGVDSLTTGRTLRLQLLLPVLFLLVFAVLPVLLVVVWSFWRYDGGQFVVGFTLENYSSALEINRLKTIFFTTRVAALTAFIAIVLAFPISYFLAIKVQSDQLKLIILLMLVIPFVVNRVLKIFSLRYMLSRNGPIAQLTGIDMPTWVLYSEFTIYVGYLNDGLPIAIFAIWLALERIEFSWIEASRDLGASSLFTFRRIILPMCAPGIAAATILLFVMVMGDVAVPEMLGGLSVYTTGQMLVSIFEAIRLSFAGAISVIVLTIIAGIFLIGQRYFKVLTIFEEVT